MVLERIEKMTQRKYTKEFRQQAVDLAANLGNTKQAAEQLGIPESNINNWRFRFKLKPTAITKSLTSDEAEELKRLRRENGDLKKVNHILKSAAAFFSQDHLK